MKFFYTILFLFWISLGSSQTSVFGTVTNTNNEPLEGAVVNIVNSDVSTVTNVAGKYSIELELPAQIILEISAIGYQPVLFFLTVKDDEKYKQNATLQLSDYEIEGVTIQENQSRDVASVYEVDTEQLKRLPAVTGGVETILKTLPGVQGNNELSSQFSVRGGSYDENLIYINGFEVVKPQLIRAGQQEGLSVINSDMVEDLYFSAGGFEAQYGDRLSSILALNYKQPNAKMGKAYLGFMGAGLALLNNSTDGNFYYNIGGRFQSNKYLLNALEEKGEYNPVSYDVQALIGANLSAKGKVEVFGITNQTTYDYEPSVRSSNFGTYNNILTFNADIFGEEEDEFSTNLIGAKFIQQVNDRFQYQISTAYQSNDEFENIDFLSQYLLGEYNSNNSIDTLSSGLQYDIVNNELMSEIMSLNHSGTFSTSNLQHIVSWGAGIQRYSYDDKLYEIDRLYSIVETDTTVVLNNELNSSNKFESTITSAYVQDTWFPKSMEQLSLTGGVRFSHNNFTEEFLVSPRMQFSIRPDWQSNILFRGAAGVYQQQPLYREFRNIHGEINNEVKAQKSAHAIIGADYKYYRGDRPFQLTGELFYKKYWDLNPYEYDVIRIRYLGENSATGYATGFDMRFYGEFVKNAPSWISASILKAEETIDGQGTVRRPTDQRLNVSAFWQDYFPNNENFKMNLVGEFGGRLPVGIADGNRLNDDFELPSYKRVDVGISANLKGERASRLPFSPFESVNAIWLSAEVFNLFNIVNTSSYQWVFTPDETVYAVPNQLTSRRFNAKFTVEF